MKDKPIQCRKWQILVNSKIRCNISTWSWVKQCKRTNNKMDKVVCSNKCRWAWFHRCRWEPLTSKTFRVSRKIRSNSSSKWKSSKRILKAKVWLSKTQCNFNKCSSNSRTSSQATMTRNNKFSNRTCRTIWPSKMATSSNLIQFNSKHSLTW